MKTVKIAIDGPSGAGKSTMARRIAEELGFVYVDTGALYRAVGLAARDRGVSMEDVEGVCALLPSIRVGLERRGSGQIATLNGEDVSGRIREPDISAYASAVSALPEVRAFLLETQRGVARESNVVMDGRDIATVVLPDADVKIFLTASPGDRARRRYEELLENGVKTTYEETLAAVLKRDGDDSSRAAAPLRRHEDAVLIDTTGNTLEKSVSVLLETVKEMLKAG